MKWNWFLAVPPGLESTLVEEVRELGMTPVSSPGGVTVSGTLEVGWKLALRSRIASRVVVRIGVARGGSAGAVTAQVRGLPWSPVIHPAQDVSVHVVGGGKVPKVRVEGAVRRGIAEALRGPRLPGRKRPRTEARVQVRLEGDRMELSVDATGELLHRRGWRQETAKAPIRENLAAAILRLSGWRPGMALVDPMCGSGTFPIEAGTAVLGLPPGGRRHFLMEDWPCVDPRVLEGIRKQARTAPVPSGPILGWDRDAGAVRAAVANLKRSGASRAVRIDQGELRDLVRPADHGLLVANPPWGQRVGGAGARGTWALFGDVARAHFGGWRVALVGPSADLLRATGLPLRQATQFPSGGQRLSVWIGAVP